MAAKEIAKDKIIQSEGQPVDALHIIAQGSVKASFNGCDVILKKGEIVGLLDAAFDSHSFTYTTLEPSSFVSVPVKDMNNFIKMAVAQNQDIAKRLCVSMLSQTGLINTCYINMKNECAALYKTILSYFDTYQSICNKNGVIARTIPHEDFEEVSLDNDIDGWTFSFYESLKELASSDLGKYSEKPAFLIGLLNKASSDIHSAFQFFDDMNEYLNDNTSLLFGESRLDIFDLFTSLAYRLDPSSAAFAEVNEHIEKIAAFLKKSGRVNINALTERVNEYKGKCQAMSGPANSSGEETLIDSSLMNSIDTIIEYSGVDEETGAEFKALINKYKSLKDKSSTEDSARKLRNDLTQSFLGIYEEAFTMSLCDTSMPIALKMFFNFGFVDVDLAGVSNTNMLYRIAKDFKGNPEKGVYTAYEWFEAIYSSKKEPSRNALDSTFQEYLHEQKVSGKITAELEERMLNDPGQRTLFELQNMFPVVNRTTYGRLSTYCPVLCEADVIKPLGTCLVSSETILDALKKIEDIDYMAFYRETMFTYNIGNTSNNESINVRIQPDIILMPNIGTRGVMWQEIEGKKRTTPARFMLSVFHIEDLPTTLARLIGEYRWEMCKRVQGARWNDITERSLTSEYCDYAQFYKKNPDLSQDAKEKVKLALSRARNSFKEMFVRDYIIWVSFEAKGSPRLNKLVRQMMVTYCPLNKANRAKLTANPIFSEIFEKQAIKNAQKVHRVDNIITKLNSLNQPVPPEIELQKVLILGDL